MSLGGSTKEVVKKILTCKEKRTFSPTIPGRGRGMFSSPNAADQLRDMPKYCSLGAGVCLRGGGVKRPRLETTLRILASRLRMHETAPSIPHLS